MYLNSSAALLRASRVRFSPPLSSLSSVSRSPLQSSPPLISYRSLSFSSEFRSLRCSAPRWSHGVYQSTPVSLRAQVRIAAPAIEGSGKRFLPWLRRMLSRES